MSQTYVRITSNKDPEKIETATRKRLPFSSASNQYTDFVFSMRLRFAKPAFVTEIAAAPQVKVEFINFAFGTAPILMPTLAVPELVSANEGDVKAANIKLKIRAVRTNLSLRANFH